MTSKTGPNTELRERGQSLVLFSFMLAVLLLVVMCVVDVGFFLHAREEAQQTADAAALAGAQELPEDPDAAEQIARDYINLNGLDDTKATITFDCTSNTQLICMDGDGRYDTIRVTPKVKAPSFFGGILSFLGFDNCWVNGCNARATAAGCRGACGPVGNAPVDAVEIIDRTGSMTSSDLTNAKNAAKSILEDFNPSLQHVGFGVLGPSSTTSLCGSPNSGGIGRSTSSGGTWLPVGLTNDYQNVNGTLNTSSTIVKTVNCLDTSSVGTDLGDPVKAATDELVANGRPDVTWGIILFTDGAANAAPTTTQTDTATNSTNTGWRDCTSVQAVTSGAGDNNGYETSGSNGCVDNNSRASDANSGTNTTVACTNSGKDKHRFYNYGFSFPGGSGVSNTVDGIEIQLRGYTNTTTGTRQFCVELSWDGGSSWTSPKSVNITSTSETAYTLGAANDTWGHSWTTGQLSNSNFRVRVTDVADNTSRTFTMDAVQARVSYTTTTTTTTTIWDGSKGPCDYAMIQADAAKAAGIEIYTIGYGVGSSDRCTDDDSDSPYYNALITDVLEDMATDANHFFDSPQGEDLEPVFSAIGGALTAGGSRLVE